VTTRKGTQAIVMAVLTASCVASGDADSRQFFPTYRHTGPGPLGLLRGELLASEACVFIVADGVIYQPIWPDGWRFESESMSVVDANGDVVADQGAKVSLVGGARSLDQAEDLIGQVPGPCQTESYWYATGPA
jgi:hypothetical protein